MENTVTITATGHVEALPDKVKIEIEVPAEADTAHETRQAVNDHENRLRDALLTETSLSKNQIRATGFQVRHREDQFDPGQIESEYRAVKEFQVHTQPERTGDIIVTATDAGASIQYVEFSLTESTRTGLEEEALKHAAENARQKAETLVQAEDATVGPVSKLEESEPSGMQTIVDDALQAGSDTDFQPTPISVSVEIKATYELVQNS
ncbi:SIMPL domain-containing protein [Halobacteria archaeon AArc-curdl1]|uniref:SIMPL domain-containing protein n=1 Tax=Natronosalvus hydrolyticus TaxID=2979988 RepID=A0AAP2ZA14_9EURY|nr:SIMPL domain-containing protein [Halobacteria archaeon AArc-curdl1]